MLDTRFIEGFEGEGQIKVWIKKDERECGLCIWEGYFNTILEGCYKKEFSSNGLIDCYYHQNGFYDDVWKLEDLQNAIQELSQFDETNVSAENDSIIKTCVKIIGELKKFIINAKENCEEVLLEYE